MENCCTLSVVILVIIVWSTKISTEFFLISKIDMIYTIWVVSQCQYCCQATILCCCCCLRCNRQHHNQHYPLELLLLVACCLLLVACCCYVRMWSCALKNNILFIYLPSALSTCSNFKNTKAHDYYCLKFESYAVTMGTNDINTAVNGFDNFQQQGIQ